MKNTEFDKEYYVMNVDGASNHPLLAWGSTDFSPFLESDPIDENSIELPLKIIFGEPYPVQYEMSDLLMLDADFSGSEKMKNLFNQLNIYGVQFVPAEIKTNKGELINSYYAIHFWNRLPAIDKNNYEGEEPNMFGNIIDLRKFSLDSHLLNEIPLEKRLVFQLEENSIMILVHQSIYDAMQSEKLTGMKFFRVDDWDDNAMFR